MRVLTVDDLDFPHATQVARGRTPPRLPEDRQARPRDGVRHHRPDQPGSPPQRLAKTIRPQWAIEKRHHFVRDTTFRENAPKAHTEHGPENMATLRSFAINCLRVTGPTTSPPDSARRPTSRPPTPWLSSNPADQYRHAKSQTLKPPCEVGGDGRLGKHSGSFG